MITDTAVGHFLTAGDKDSTAIVYVNLTSVNTTTTATPDVSGAGK